jgi:hypothetical protein
MNLDEALPIFQQLRPNPLMPWVPQPDHICNQRRFHRLRNCPWGMIDDNGVWVPPDVYTEADARRDTPEELSVRLRSGGPLKPA